MAIFTNQATMSYGNTVVNSNVATGEILGALTVTKDTLSENYSANSEKAYVITVSNDSANDFTGLNFTDNLGRYPISETISITPLTYVDGSIRYYVDGELQATPAVTATSPLTVTGINVPAGSNATIIYSAVTNNFADLSLGSTIINTATFTGGGLAVPVTDSSAIIADSFVDLSISKSMSPETVSENDTLTYTFIIQNNGNAAADAATGVVVTDNLDPALSNITVTLDGTILTPNRDYTYNEATGDFATVSGVITVPSATFAQDPTSGAFTTTPGVSTLTISGTV